jgi:TonB family protein
MKAFAPSILKTLVLSFMLHAALIGIIFKSYFREKQGPRSAVYFSVAEGMQNQGKRKKDENLGSRRKKARRSIPEKRAQMAGAVPDRSAGDHSEKNFPDESKSIAAGPTHGGSPGAASLLLKKIESFLEYPSALRQQGIQGQVKLVLTISSTGSLEKVFVSRSSGNQQLDDLALKAVQAAAPFEEFMNATGNNKEPESITLHLPIEFTLRLST